MVYVESVCRLAGFREAIMMRFTIRDLLLLTSVVGLAVGWGVDHLAMASAGWREK